MTHNRDLHPMPFENLLLPDDLAGVDGSNRARGLITKQIAANNDLQAIQTWLAEFNGSPQTQRAYRKEAERILLWTLIERHKPLSSLTRDDLQLYQAFLSDPKPASLWCGERKSRQHPDWKPFEAPLSPSSLAHAITVINALFSYLVEAGYLAGNPLGLMRKKMHKEALLKTQTIERFLEQETWQYVVDYLANLPRTTPEEITFYERINFLFHWFYLLGPRISEVANAHMSDIHEHLGRWWWQVTGKGKKVQRIPLNTQVITVLTRYRAYYGLSPLPHSDENHALFMSLKGNSSVSSNMIYRLVKSIFLDCASSLEKEKPTVAKKLSAASTHWLRHTSITHQSDAGIELRYIKRSARHENIQTTMLYQHAEDHLWHEAMEKHKVKSFSDEPIP